MNDRDHDQDQELLEYLFDCHPDPAALERRLAQDPGLREALERVRSTAGLLEEAAREDASAVALPRRAPHGGGRRRRRWWPRALAAAACLILVPAAALWGWSAREASEARTLADTAFTLEVSGPPGVPDGTSASFHVTTHAYSGKPRRAQVHWAAWDEEMRLLHEDSCTTDGSLDLFLPADLAGVRHVKVTAEADGFQREVLQPMTPHADAPLAHLTADKVVYRPGERVYLRAVLLDRMSLRPREGRYHFRLVDAKDTQVRSWTWAAEEGVVAASWVVPEDAAGGRYTFELRDREDAFSFESHSFLVQRFQPPQLDKSLTLDRETYAAGSEGSAELVVAQLDQGPVAGWRVDASLVVDGDVTWTADGTLDQEGRAVFTFPVPATVRAGEGRFVAVVSGGGIVETALEPFVIPTDSAVVHFFPEGGDLVAGARNTVYVRVDDALGRAMHAEGTVVDAAGRAVAAFETLHQGRGRFSFTPAEGAAYHLELAVPQESRFDLPEVKAQGVVLHAQDESVAPGAPLRLAVSVPDDGPYAVGVFCRGLCVAQQTLRGAGDHEVTMELAPGLGGVLRVTVFDGTLHPVAERLVHRRTDRALLVDVETRDSRVLPGGGQEVTVRTRDESGAPVSAVVGLVVSDQAVRAFTGEVRVGLADQTWLFADVEEREDQDEYRAQDPEGALHVDLLLGTEGWRRFAWVDPEALLAKEGDRARRLVVREGRPQHPSVLQDAGDAGQLVRAAQRRSREAERWASAWLVLGLASGLLGLAFVGGYALCGRFLSTLVVNRIAAGTATAVVLVGGLALVLQAVGPDARFAGVDLAATGDALPPRRGAAREPETILEEEDLLALEDTQWRRVDRFALDGEVDELRDGLWADDLVIGEAADADGAPAEPPLLEANLAFELERLGYTDPADRNEGLQRQVREYAHRRADQGSEVRQDFTETVYWNGLLRTDQAGVATVTFDVSDRVTTWEVHADAHGAGRVGQGATRFQAVPPLRVTAKIPTEVTVGDRLLLPVAIAAEGAPAFADVAHAVRGGLRSAAEAVQRAPLTAGRGRVLLDVTVDSVDPTGAALALRAVAGEHEDRVQQALRVVPRGYPHHVSRSGQAEGRQEWQVALPDDFDGASLDAILRLYPTPLADLLSGMEGMLQEPHGCFEQTSSTHYPNILALRYLDSAGLPEPAVASRGRQLLASGYERLVGFECDEKGYEWFGHDPGHEALTAYGLLEFQDMAPVMAADEGMVARTREWLLGRRDEEGGFHLNDGALDTFGKAPTDVSNAYITYALTVTGEDPRNLAAELDRVEARSLESEDAYEVAVAACSLQEAGRTEAAHAARERLKMMQGEDGGLTGAVTSITSSRGDDLRVEATSFAVLAWLADEEDMGAVEKAVRYLRTRRQDGRFGATQATVMALKALLAYAEAAPRDVVPGTITLFVNDRRCQEVALSADSRNVLEFTRVADALRPGANTLRLELPEGNQMPFAFDMEYHAEQPADDPRCPVRIQARLAQPAVDEGQVVTLDVLVENLTDEPLAMTMGAVGLPAGLDVAPKLLDELQEAGRFAFWERRGRMLYFYWRNLGPGAAHALTLDLEARVPGMTTGPASHAWLYYMPQAKDYCEPLEVTVRPKE